MCVAPIFFWFFHITHPGFVTQVPLSSVYTPLIVILFQSATSFVDIADLSPLLLQYGILFLIFHVLGFATDNSVLNSQIVHLFPPRPPKPRGFYARRRRHRHYFRRKKSCLSGLCLLSLPVLSKCYSSVSPFELFRLEQDHMARTQHKFLHLSWVMIDFAFDVNFSKFIHLIDPLHEFRLCQCLSSDNFFQPSLSNLPCLAPSSTSSLFRTTSLFNVLLQEPPTDSVPPDFNDMPVVIDTGASVSLTPVLSDFIGPLVPTQLTELKGLTAKTHVVGKGMVEWPIRDYWNVPGVIKTSAYYVPDASIRLFSPQSFFQEHENQGRCIIHGRKATMEFTRQHSFGVSLQSGK